MKHRGQRKKVSLNSAPASTLAVLLMLMTPFLYLITPGDIITPGGDRGQGLVGYGGAGGGTVTVALGERFLWRDQGTLEEIYPPWELYGWNKIIEEWGGHEGWGARTGNSTQCTVTDQEGSLAIESRAFGAKCRVTAWFGHFASWQCPQTGPYEITFNYTYDEGLSEAIYTIHPDFSGELRTEMTLTYYYGDNFNETLVFTRFGRHLNEKFQGITTAAFRLTCYAGSTYLLGTNLTLMAYTDSWDEAESYSKIRVHGHLNKITLERINMPPATPSRPIGTSLGTSGKLYTYASSATDPDGDPLYYLFDWGDSATSGWRGPYPPGSPGNASRTWPQGNFSIRVKAKDGSGAESGWSEPLIISMPLRTITWGEMGIRGVMKQIFSYLRAGGWKSDHPSYPHPNYPLWKPRD